MKLILTIGMMCFAIFMLAFMALLLATQGGMAEFLQWLAQSGPIEWFGMAFGAGVIWLAIGYPLFFLHPKDWMEYWKRLGPIFPRGNPIHPEGERHFGLPPRPF